MKHLEYKSYTGSISYDRKEKLFYGQVQGIKSLISYEGVDGPSLESDFQGAIDEYLKECDEEGIEPERAFKGSFNIRVSPHVHKKLFWAAQSKRMSLNSYVQESLSAALDRLDKKSK